MNGCMLARWEQRAVDQVPNRSIPGRRQEVGYGRTGWPTVRRERLCDNGGKMIAVEVLAASIAVVGRMQEVRRAVMDPVSTGRGMCRISRVMVVSPTGLMEWGVCSVAGDDQKMMPG